MADEASMAESSAMLAAPRTPIADGMRPTDAFADRQRKKGNLGFRRESGIGRFGVEALGAERRAN